MSLSMVMIIILLFEKQPPEAFCKKGVLSNFAKFTGKTPIPDSLFLRNCNFIKKETLAQVFSREFCEISEKTFFSLNTSG